MQLLVLSREELPAYRAILLGVTPFGADIIKAHGNVFACDNGPVSKVHTLSGLPLRLKPHFCIWQRYTPMDLLGDKETSWTWSAYSKSWSKGEA